MQGLNIIIEGRKKPLYVKPRKINGAIYVDVLHEGEVVAIITTGESFPTIIIKDPKVAVVYE